MRGRVWLTNGAVAFAVVATVAVYAVSDDEVVRNTAYLGLLVAASIGAWVGAERTSRERRRVPRLIAAGLSLSALGDVLWTVLDLRGVDTDASVADIPWLASYVVLGTALWLVLTRATHGQVARRRPDVDFLIDVASIVAVGVMVLWTTALDAIVDDGSLPVLVRVLWVSYPLADAVLLALVLRILMSREGRGAFDAFFAVGICLWLAADLGYLVAPDSDKAQLAMDTLWMVAPVLIARSAWRVGEVEAASSRASLQGSWLVQVVLAAGPLAVPPALELVGNLHNGTEQPLRLLSGTALMAAVAFVRIGRLIRAKERTTRELERARDEALEASRAKSMFVANMSHEIRTPLTSVLASSEMLEDTPLDEFQLQLIEKMQRSGTMLKSLVEDILDFSRIEAGQVVLSPTTFDLTAFVVDLDDVYRVRAAEKGLRFTSHLDPSAPRTVVGDAGRLLQVLTNLLDNALKFSDQGHVALDVHPVANGRQRGVAGLEFRVSDSGIGISAQHQQMVFQSFTQVDGTVTRRHGGTGLGLAISKDLTELMGGALTVSSEPGQGSVFSVSIPLIPVDVPRADTSTLTTSMPVSA
jgi:signal transduction histidine kinase